MDRLTQPATPLQKIIFGIALIWLVFGVVVALGLALIPGTISDSRVTGYYLCLAAGPLLLVLAWEFLREPVSVPFVTLWEGLREIRQK